MLPRRPTMTGRSRIVWTVLLLGFVLRAGVAFSADLKFPPLTGRVVDDAGILSPSTISELDEMLAQHEHTTSEQIVVATLGSLQGHSIEDYGYQLGRSWGIGQKGKNNGAIFIVAPNEHKVRVEVGYGLEGQLTDAASRVIIENYITPQFRKGDFNAGVLAGTAGIMRALGDEAAANLGGNQETGAPANENDPNQLSASDALILLIFFGCVIFLLMRRNRLPYVMRHGTSSGSSGYYGGGSSGGGFSGGGFCRRWRIIRRWRRVGELVRMAIPLTTEDHRRIREAATAVEERSGAKIAIVITRVSERYALYTMAWASIGAFTAGGLAIATRPALRGSSLIFIELCALVAMALLLEVLPIRLAMVPERVKQASARNLAHREFTAHPVADGTHPMRILFFVSIGERYVEIIADHATHAIAPTGTWKRIVDDFIAAVKSDRIADGVVTAIESCGAILPRRSEASKAD